VAAATAQFPQEAWSLFHPDCGGSVSATTLQRARSDPGHGGFKQHPCSSHCANQRASAHSATRSRREADTHLPIQKLV
jgi:hypothetical protein